MVFIVVWQFLHLQRSGGQHSDLQLPSCKSLLNEFLASRPYILYDKEMEEDVRVSDDERDVGSDDLGPGYD